MAASSYRWRSSLKGARIFQQEAPINSTNHRVFFGVLKQKFNCLAIPLRVDPCFAGKNFKACCVLQNLTVDESENVEEFDLAEDQEDQDIDGPVMRDSDPRREIARLMRDL